MNFKKIGMGIALTAAFGLMACGDNSSSSPSSNEKDSTSQDGDYSQLVQEVADAMEKLGNCTDDNDGDKDKVVVDGKTFTVVCTDGVWESEELDEFLEEKILDGIRDSLGMQGNGCNFKMSDRKWDFEYTAEHQGAKMSYTVNVEVSSDKFVQKTTVVAKDGEAVKAACRELGSKVETETDTDGSETLETKTSCSNGVLTSVETLTDKGYKDSEDRQERFNDVMEECQLANGNYSWKPEGSSSSSKGSVESSSSNGGSVTDSDDQEDYFAKDPQNCKFKASDKIWIFGDYKYEWIDEKSYFVYDYDAGAWFGVTSEKSCKDVASTMGSLVDEKLGEKLYCEGSRLISKSYEELEESTREDLYRNKMLNNCYDVDEPAEGSSDSDEDDYSSSSEEKIDSSSSSEKESSSSTYVPPETTCKADGDVWSSSYVSEGTVYTTTYTFDGDNVIKQSYYTMDLEDATTCQLYKSMMLNVSIECDGSVARITEQQEILENVDKDELKAEVLAPCQPFEVDE